MSIFQNISFFTSVNNLQTLPSPFGSEVAFAGRSNSGKSSAINTLTNRGKLAFVSKTPGRTQLINFFKLDGELFLVDLPGYGFAKVPLAIRQHWELLLSEYLQTRSNLRGLVLIMDVRHPLKPLDIKMLDWFVPTGKPVHILLTKSDKLSRQKAKQALGQVDDFLSVTYPQCSVQLFSSLSKQGIEDVTDVISHWLDLKKRPPV